MRVIPHDASELARVLGGVRATGTILLAGEAGAGKSTVAAELAAAVAEAHDGQTYWLDRDQQAHDLIADLFTRVDASMNRVVLVKERDPLEEGYEPLDWRSALADVPGDAACAVWDSLETWSDSYAEQADLARARSQDCGSNPKTRSSWSQRQAFAMRAAHATASSREGSSSTVKPPSSGGAHG